MSAFHSWSVDKRQQGASNTTGYASATTHFLLVAELAKARQEAAAAASSSSKAIEATSDDMPVLQASKTAADDSTFGNLAAESLSQSDPDVEAAAANIM